MVLKKENKTYKSFLKKAGGNEGELCYYPIRLDSYGKGCEHNCTYCYARAGLERYKVWDNFHPTPASIDEIKKIFDKALNGVGNLSKAIQQRVPIRLGGMTDPFTPYEKDAQVTYELLKYLNSINYPYLIVTKNAMIAEDKYLSILNKDLAAVQVTITTLRPSMAWRIETNASTVHDRVKAIKALADNNIYVQARISPFFPEHPDGFHSGKWDGKHKPFANFSWNLINEVCEVGAKTVVAEFIRFYPSTLKWLSEESGLDLKYLINENSIFKGGAWHFSFEEKLFYYTRVKSICNSYGVDFTVCEDAHFHEARFLWANHHDCCNLKNSIPAFNITCKEVL